MPREIKKKNITQDVIPPKRSIRNIELSSRKKIAQQAVVSPITPEPVRDFTRPTQKPSESEPAVSSAATMPPPTSPTPPASSYTYEYAEPKKPRQKWLYGSMFLLLAVVGFGISALFKSARIQVAPKQETKAVNQIFTAKANVLNESDLGFQVVTATKSVEKTVVGGTSQKVETKAIGTVVIYNNYSATSQKLVATTRLQTPEGLIFRLVSPATVPGKTTKAGKVVAGSVEVTVEADTAGPAYNIGLTDFTIPGLKTDNAKYTTIYGRSKTEMTGGFSGQQKVVSKEVMDASNTEMEQALRVSIQKDLESGIPANFILYPDSISYVFEKVTQTKNSGDNAILKLKGAGSGIIFDKGNLTQAIFAKTKLNIAFDTVKITNLEGLTFSYASGTVANISGLDIVNFTLSGNAKLVWMFDENKLKSDLLGLSKTDAETVISKVSGVQEAWVETQPFWNSTIPNNPDKVTIINTAKQE